MLNNGITLCKVRDTIKSLNGIPLFQSGDTVLCFPQNNGYEIIGGIRHEFTLFLETEKEVLNSFQPLVS